MMRMNVFCTDMTAEKTAENEKMKFFRWFSKECFTRSYEYSFRKLKQRHHDRMKRVESLDEQLVRTHRTFPTPENNKFSSYFLSNIILLRESPNYPPVSMKN